MSLQVKYAEVLALANKLGVKDMKVAEEAGKLSISGTTKTQYAKM